MNLILLAIELGAQLAELIKQFVDGRLEPLELIDQTTDMIIRTTGVEDRKTAQRYAHKMLHPYLIKEDFS